MKCCVCKGEIEKKYSPEGKMYWDSGNNAQPLAEGRCCDKCDCMLVIPMRMGLTGDRAIATGVQLWLMREGETNENTKDE